MTIIALSIVSLFYLSALCKYWNNNEKIRSQNSKLNSELKYYNKLFNLQKKFIDNNKLTTQYEEYEEKMIGRQLGRLGDYVFSN